MFKKTFAILLTLCLAASAAAGCGNSGTGTPSATGDSANTTAQAPTEAPAAKTSLPKLDTSKRQQDPDSAIYYQFGITYCESPADERYEKLAVFVPAAYLDATANGDGTFTCKLNETAEINGYTAATAPIAMPIITPGYYAAEAITEETLPMVMHGMHPVTDLTDKGLVYVFPGCRGIDEGVPSGVTDLKAAVRYLRYCDGIIPGSAERIFAFGSSGGGAQSTILGAAGDSALYDPYLEKIGAVSGVSDAIAGSISWCPITDLDTANAEYEWMMGCTREGRTAEADAISDGLANAFVTYLNSAGFTDAEGNALTLTESAEGIYQAGTYYEYLKSVIEQSLNNYLSDTTFRQGSAEDYINDLNADKPWITYDKATNTATITSIADFVKHCKRATDLLVAFDQPTSGNNLFGYGDGKPSHFDKILADVLTSLNHPAAASYHEDLAKTDACGNTVLQRMDMYTPLYYLMKTRDGCGKSTVAKYWRIRSGIEQANTALTTEVNLALALAQCDGVKNVDFETVWEQDHTEAERTGDSTENFVAWINACLMTES